MYSVNQNKFSSQEMKSPSYQIYILCPDSYLDETQSEFRT